MMSLRARFRIVALVALVVLGLLGAVHVPRAHSQVRSLNTAMWAVNSDALPGGTVDFVATIENPSDLPTNNLELLWTVTGYSETLTYLEGSMKGDFGDGNILSIPELQWPATLRIDTIQPSQRMHINWSMEVAECTLRDRHAEVTLQISSDDFGRVTPIVHRQQIYILPHQLTQQSHLTSRYSVHPPTPAPGDTVEHRLNLINDGTVLLGVRVRGVPSDTSFYTIDGRNGERSSAQTIEDHSLAHAIDWWWWPDSGVFEHRKLEPGEILVLFWIEHIADNAEIGAEIGRHVEGNHVPIDSARRHNAMRRDSVFSVSGTDSEYRVDGQVTTSWRPWTHSLAWPESWKSLSRPLNVVAPRGDLDMRIDVAADDRAMRAFYPGESTRISARIVNRTDGVIDDLRLVVSLPFAVKYVRGSSSYSISPDFVGGNARRMRDTWTDDGVELPSLAPRESIDVSFDIQISDDADADQTLEIIADLWQQDHTELRSSVTLHVEPIRKLDIVIQEPLPVVGGEELLYNVRITNVGQVDLDDVQIGIEETCDARYEPYSLTTLIPHSSAQTKGFRSADPSETDIKNGVLTKDLGQLPRGQSAEVTLKVHVTDDIDGLNIEGPRFVVNSGGVDADVIRQETTIAIVQPTLAEILDEIRSIAQETKVTTERTKGLVEDIQTVTGYVNETTEVTQGLVDKTQGLTEEAAANSAITLALIDDVKEVTAATQGIGETILAEVEEVDPWAQSPGWILNWGSFGLLASFFAGLLLAFPAWQILKWLRRGWRRWLGQLLRWLAQRGPKEQSGGSPPSEG